MFVLGCLLREVIIKEFSPNEAFDHIFAAVPNAPELLAAIKYKDNLERDYLFKRAETEQFLFSAAEDLSCGGSSIDAAVQKASDSKKS